jgi:3-oxoacyl-[acyl-carrier-protein] synthase II
MNAPYTRRRSPPRRVAVTGLGLITPCGTGVERSWAALLEGRSGVGPITLFDASRMPTRFAGEAQDFKGEDFLPRKEMRRMDRFEHLAIAAADMAIASSGLQISPANAERIAVIVGSGIGGLASIDQSFRTLIERGPEKVTPYLILQISMNLAPGFISIRHGIKGPSWSTSSACATGAHAIGEAMRGIERGDFDVAVAGGAEAPVTALALAGFSAMGALSKRNDDPAAASRPFDQQRDGFVLAEGAGILVLESLEHARARGARVWAELSGYAATSDAHHVTSPAPAHEGGQRCMRLALADAALQPADVGYLNAHGTSTEVGDRLEAEAVAAIFGAHATAPSPGLAVSSTKSMTGHMNGAAGAAEAVISVLALAHGMIPPTINLASQDPAIHLDCVPQRARAKALTAVMSNAFGFGGTNATLIFSDPASGDDRWGAGAR